MSKKNKSRRDNTAKSSEPKAPATGMSEALKAAGIVADRVMAAVEPEAVLEAATEPEAAPVETPQPEAVATTGADEPELEQVAAPELTARWIAEFAGQVHPTDPK